MKLMVVVGTEWVGMIGSVQPGIMEVAGVA